MQKVILLLNFYNQLQFLSSNNTKCAHTNKWGNLSIHSAKIFVSIEVHVTDYLELHVYVWSDGVVEHRPGRSSM